VRRPDDLHSEVLTLLAAMSLLENLVCYVMTYTNTVELGYSDLNLCDALSVALHIQWYQLIPHTARVFLPCLM